MMMLCFQPQSMEVLKKGIHMLVCQHYACLHITPTALALGTALKYTEFEGSIIKYCHTQMKVQRHNKQLTSFRGVSERKGSSAANMADEIIIHASIILLK